MRGLCGWKEENEEESEELVVERNLGVKGDEELKIKRMRDD